MFIYYKMEDKRFKTKNNDKIDELSSKIDKMIELQMFILELISNNKKILKKNNNEFIKDKITDLNEISKEIEIENLFQEDIDIDNKKLLIKQLLEDDNPKKIVTKQSSKDEIGVNDEIIDKKILIKQSSEEETGLNCINEKIKKKNQSIKNYEYKDVKREFFNIDDKIIKDCLNMNNLSGDIKLFKKMYIENIPKEFYPIRHIQKKFQYWLNNHMVDDDCNGTYIKNIILSNIENCYLRINIFDNYSDNMEQFLKNQEHINKLSENKYKDNFLNKIISLINI